MSVNSFTVVQEAFCKLPILRAVSPAIYLDPTHQKSDDYICL